MKTRVTPFLLFAGKAEEKFVWLSDRYTVFWQLNLPNK